MPLSSATPTPFTPSTGAAPKLLSPSAESRRAALQKKIYATVVLDRSQSQLDKELTYGIPDELRGELRLGFAVLVPVGRQYLTGYITGFPDSIDFDEKSLRNISKAVSTTAVFDSRALQVARWMSAYYHCPLADCLCCYVPQGSQQTTEKRYSYAASDREMALRPLARSPRQLQVAQLLLRSDSAMTEREMERQLPGAKLRETIKKLVADGVLKEEDELLDPSVKPRIVQAVRAFPESRLLDGAMAKLERGAPKQAFALKKLFELHALHENDQDSVVLSSAPANGLTPQVQPNSTPPVSAIELAHDWG
ncbi:MAG TPA: hypothetical protein VF719_06540, partial [Abditibacteriaceae bacterium]